jgi:hypothetical protein
MLFSTFVLFLFAPGISIEQLGQRSILARQRANEQVERLERLEHLERLVEDLESRASTHENPPRDHQANHQKNMVTTEDVAGPASAP